MSMLERKERWFHCYNSSQKILLVGEGDFSFSACLARALGGATNMVATSYHDQNLQVQKHWTSVQHLADLKRLGCLLLYKVDVYNMHKHPILKEMKFDIIIYNFPHAGHYCMHETSWTLIEMHRNLVRAYLESASKLLNEGGEVHLRHRDDHPYDKWNVVLLAEEAGLKLKAKVDFLVSDYPGYKNIRGGDIRTNETFPIKCAFTFKFSLDLPMVGDDHPKNVEVLDHRLTKKDEVHESEMADQDLAEKHTRNDVIYDHGLSKNDKIHVSENRDDLHAIYEHMHDLDLLEIKGEVHVCSEMEVEDYKHQDSKNVQEHDLLKKDEIEEYLYVDVLEMKDNINQQHAKIEIIHDHLPRKDEKSDDTDVSVPEMKDDVYEHETMNLETADLIPKMDEVCVDFDVLSVTEMKEPVKEECVKIDFDVVHELMGLSLLDVCKDVS